MSAPARPSRWKRLSWPHPEWWSICLCAAAWLLLWRAGPAAAGAHASHGRAHHDVGAGALGWGPSLTAEAFWWFVMVVAMMFPMVLDPVRATAGRSLWRRRHRAIAGFLLGYLAPWMLFGVAASAVAATLRSGVQPSPAYSAAAFGAALLWQVTPPKRRALLGCHRTRPLAPSGWRADLDCLRYGCAVGRSCLVSCWALMLACVLSGHGLAAMLGATSVGWAERNTARPNQLVLCAVIAALALTYAVAAYA